MARVSPYEALKRVASEAGYGAGAPDVTPVLNFYLDARNKWHLAYVVENITAGRDKSTAANTACRWSTTM